MHDLFPEEIWPIVDAERISERIVREHEQSTFFICPKCGMVFSRRSRHNFGTFCSFCATEDEIKLIEKKKEDMLRALDECYNGNFTQR